MAWQTADLVPLLEAIGCPVTDHDEDSVSFGISGDEPGRPRAARVDVQLTEPVGMLTFTVTYPFSAPVPRDARLAGALLAPYLVLGQTRVTDDGGVYHRYTMLVGSDGPDPDVVGQVVAILAYEQLHFGDYLEAVCVRGASIEIFADLVAAGEASPAGDLA